MLGDKDTKNLIMIYLDVHEFEYLLNGNEVKYLKFNLLLCLNKSFQTLYEFITKVAEF